MVSAQIKKMAPLLLSLLTVIAIVYIVVPTTAPGVSSAKQLDNICSELFWIGIFSFTAKAALSISYDDEETNPNHCRVMCLIGIVYCFLVDRSLFAYTFTLEQIVLGVAIAVLTLLMLCIHTRLYDEDRQATFEKSERD